MYIKQTITRWCNNTRCGISEDSIHFSTSFKISIKRCNYTYAFSKPLLYFISANDMCLYAISTTLRASHIAGIRRNKFIEARGDDE